jgi:hypothetical protein
MPKSTALPSPHTFVPKRSPLGQHKLKGASYPSFPLKRQNTQSNPRVRTLLSYSTEPLIAPTDVLELPFFLAYAAVLGVGVILEKQRKLGQLSGHSHLPDRGVGVVGNNEISEQVTPRSFPQTRLEPGAFLCLVNWQSSPTTRISGNPHPHAQEILLSMRMKRKSLGNEKIKLRNKTTPDP